jgi:hypothetical protein
MNEPKRQSKEEGSSSFDAFRDLAAKLVRVPKAEADKQEAVYQRERKKKPKPGPKPK